MEKLWFKSVQAEHETVPWRISINMQKSPDLITLKSTVPITLARPVDRCWSLIKIIRSALEACFTQELIDDCKLHLPLIPLGLWDPLKDAKQECDSQNKTSFVDNEGASEANTCGLYIPDQATSKRILNNFCREECKIHGPTMIDVRDPLDKRYERMGDSYMTKNDSFFLVVADLLFGKNANIRHLCQIRRFISVVCHQLSQVYFTKDFFDGYGLEGLQLSKFVSTFKNSVLDIYSPILNLYKSSDIDLDLRKDRLTLLHFKKVMKMYSLDVMKPGYVPGSPFEALILSSTTEFEIRIVSLTSDTQKKLNAHRDWYIQPEPNFWFKDSEDRP
jgi:hypothetical protein